MKARQGKFIDKYEQLIELNLIEIGLGKTTRNRIKSVIRHIVIEIIEDIINKNAHCKNTKKPNKECIG